MYRRAARNGHVTLTGGDAIGATPPISAFFGDKPTIEAMNMMGFKLDGLGNHNFDRGQQYFRDEIVPLANFDYLSANVTRRARRRPSGPRARCSPSARGRVASGSGSSASRTRTPRRSSGRMRSARSR